MRNRTLVCCWLLQAAVLAQTQVDLRTQSKAVDFSGAASTQPAKKGTTLPSTCVTGEQFFKTDAAAGQNLYVCASANSWTPVNATCATCVTAPAPLTNLNIMAGAGSQASKITNILVDTGMSSMLVPGTVTTGDGSAAGEVLLYEIAANGTTYFSWLGVDSRATTLRAKVPSTDPTAGQVMLFSAPVSGVSTITWGSPGSGGGGTGAPNYTQSFSSATTVSLTHGLGTKNLILACLDANDVFIEPAAWSIGQSSPFNIAVTFASAQTGRCVVNGTGVGGTSAAKYGTTFTSQTSVSISGSTHNLGSADLVLACYDASTIRNRIEPDRMTVDPATSNIVVSFFAPQSGRCVLM